MPSRLQLTHPEHSAALGHRDRPPKVEGYVLGDTHLSSDPNPDT